MNYDNLKNIPATLIRANGERIRGEYTGYSSILSAYMFSAYNGEVIKFGRISSLIID